MARKKIGEILIAAGLIDQAGLRSGLAEQARWGGPLGRILIDMRLVSEPDLVAALSQQLAVPVVDLDALHPPPEILGLVPSDFALDHTVVPFGKAGKFLDLAMTDPTNQGLSDELRIRTQLNIRPYLAGPKAIERALARWYKRGPGMLTPGMQRDMSISGSIPMMNELSLKPGKPLDLELGRMNLSTPLPTAAASPALAAAPAAAPTTPGMHLPAGGAVGPPPGPAIAAVGPSVEEVRALQSRITKLEALVSRDEDVLRKLLSLIVDKGIASREEILERLR